MIGGAPIAMMQQNTLPFGMQPQPHALPQQPSFPQQQPSFAGQPPQGMPRQPSFPAQPPQGMPRQPNYAAAPTWQPQQPLTPNPMASAPSFPRIQDPAPVVRGYAQEEPAPTATFVSLPSPSALGITSGSRAAEAATPGVQSVPVAVATIDWNATHQRLRQLGVVGFHLDAAPQGGFRVLCVLTGQGKETQAIEGTGATEAQAVAQAMARCEQARK